MAVNIGLKMTGCFLSVNKDTSVSYEFIFLYANFVNYFETVLRNRLGAWKIAIKKRIFTGSRIRRSKPIRLQELRIA